MSFERWRPIRKAFSVRDGDAGRLMTTGFCPDRFEPAPADFLPFGFAVLRPLLMMQL
jgi:hypothetical protein